MGLSSIQDYYHLGRKPSIITLLDDDSMVFYNDFLFANISYGQMDLKSLDAAYVRASTGSVDYSNQRVLQFGRFSKDKNVNGLRIVPYFLSGTSYIAPFFDIHQQEISYTIDSNILTMTFWTNFTSDWTSTDGYDPSKIYQQYSPDTLEWDDPTPDDIQKAFFIATGSIQKYHITGGAIDGSGTTDDSLDFVPVFQTPQLIPPYGNWSDVSPYPGSGSSTPNTVIFSFPSGATTLPPSVEIGMPLLPIFGTSGVDISQNLLLKSPKDFSDSDGIDGNPFYYVYAGEGPQGFHGPQQLATYPTGVFNAKTNTSAVVGQGVGVVHGVQSFVVGSVGARCIAYKAPATIALLVRDSSSALIRAVTDVSGNRQKVQSLAEDDTLSGIDLNLFDPPISLGFQFSGVQGKMGFQGIPGFQGPIGLPGFDGTQGLAGSGGFQGFDGSKGFQGFTGAGFQGFTGLQGNNGNTGLQGFNGIDGVAGGFGPQGFTGSGFQGFTGTQGFQGSGTQGFQGPQGFTGLQGINPNNLFVTVKAYATSGGTSGTPVTIDGISCSTGDQVGIFNSVYIVSSGPWSLTSPQPKAFCVQQGTANGRMIYVFDGSSFATCYGALSA